MAQDPKKEVKDYEKPSLKDKLKQYGKEKKSPLKEVGEMGKPSLRANFESAMQKQYKSRPENMKEKFGSELKELPSKEVKVPSKKKYKYSLMMSMNKLD